MKDISLEDFSDKVKESFKKDNSFLTDDEVDKYFETEEAIKEILYAYSSALKRYKSGEYSYDVFMIGCVASVAFCLTYMYE